MSENHVFGRLVEGVRGWLGAAALALGAGVLGGGVTATPAQAQIGEFNVANYATGTIANNNWLWRGYVFSPSRDVTITGLLGGSGTNCSAGFNGAIYEVTISGNNYTIGDALRIVNFSASQNLVQEFQEFDTPLQLSADRYYLMAQGRVSSGSGCHISTNQLDVTNLVIGSAIIDEWFPAHDSALQPSGSGTGTHLQGQTRSFSQNTDVRVLMGFRYLTGVNPAQIGVETLASQIDGTNNVVLSGILDDSGIDASEPDAELTLYFEYATNPDFTNSTLAPADPFLLTGPQQDVPFGVTVEGLNPGTTYYYRAVAINEAGRVSGDTRQFTLGDMDASFQVSASVVLEGDATGSVTPATRGVPDGETTTFALLLGPDTRVRAITTTCGDLGTLDGNVYTTGPITEGCEVVFTFAPETTDPSPETSLIFANPTEITANGSDTSLITVQLRDAAGEDITEGGAMVTMQTTLGTLGPVTDNGDGTYTAVLTAGTVRGEALITGTVNGASIVNTATVLMLLDEQFVRDSFTEVTSAFLMRRMDRIISAEPRRHRLNHRRELEPGLHMQMSASGSIGDFATRLMLSRSPGERVTGGIDATRSEVSPGMDMSLAAARLSSDRRYHLWVEGLLSTYTDSTGALDTRDGRFGIVFMGADVLVNDNLSLGMMLHVDRTRERIAGYSEVGGTGWMVGPYMSAELHQSLFLTARAAYGQSSNDASIDVFGDGDIWQGAFDTRRRLLHAALHGEFETSGRMLLRPQLDIAYMREQQRDYTVTSGDDQVAVDGVDLDIGRLGFSGTAEWPLQTSNVDLRVFVSPRLEYDWRNDWLEDDERFRGSLEVGLRNAPDADWTGEISLRRDGIGQGSFDAWSLRANAAIRF